ncbi:MAG: hypothetical protein PF445_09375 [Melioribacteraceae bacterium]|jgi:hypothetical protein|nr:hypothetical protein [Melioribacteraceae bacterium]
MKSLIITLLFSSSIIFSQGIQTESLELLKYQLNQNIQIENDE